MSSHRDEDSDITERATNRKAHGIVMPPRAGMSTPTSFGATRGDKEISAYVKKLNESKDDTKMSLSTSSHKRFDISEAMSINFDRVCARTIM